MPSVLQTHGKTDSEREPEVPMWGPQLAPHFANLSGWLLCLAPGPSGDSCPPWDVAQIKISSKALCRTLPGALGRETQVLVSNQIRPWWSQMPGLSWGHVRVQFHGAGHIYNSLVSAEGEGRADRGWREICRLTDVSDRPWSKMSWFMGGWGPRLNLDIN
jgi:hypothetical protein